MNEEVSVNKAIRRGHIMVNLPSLSVFIGILLVSLYLYNNRLIPVWGMGIGFIIGFIASWAIWSFMITRWRIWAFNNVRNVHELKERAIEDKLIWSDGSIFEKTEIRSKEDIEELDKLDSKFNQEDIYLEDYSMPHVSKIYYSKTDTYYELIVSVIILGIGIAIFCFPESTIKNYVIALIMILIGTYNSRKELKKAFNKNPIIIIDNTGIKTKNTEFVNWTQIYNEDIIREGFGKNREHYLTYFYGDELEFEKLKIDSLDKTHEEIENMIRTYRIRFNKGLR